MRQKKTDGVAKGSPACRRAVLETVEALCKAGHECIEIDASMVCEATLYLTANLSSGSSYPVAAAFYCVLATIPVTQNVITRFAPLTKTIATANDVIVGIGIRTETETGTGTVAGENERTMTVTLSVTGNAQIALTATEITNAAAIVKKGGPATRKNADEIARAKTTDAGHTPVAITREAPLAVRAAAMAANITVAYQIAACQHPWESSRSCSASASPATRTFVLQDMNCTRLCRQSKPVRIALSWKTACI